MSGGYQNPPDRELAASVERIGDMPRFLLGLTLLVLAASPAPGEPFVSDIEDVLRPARAVVVAQLVRQNEDQSRSKLRVEEVVWGQASLGEQWVEARSCRRHRALSSTRVLAFLEEGDHWVFHAPLRPGPLAPQPLRVEGFYDGNAHHVRDASLSLPELLHRLDHPRASPPPRRLRGYLRFLKPDGSGHERGPRLAVRTGSEPTLSGWGDLRPRNLPPRWRLADRCWGSEGLSLEWWGQGSERSLALAVIPERIGADGAWEVRFEARKPALFTRRLFRDWAQRLDAAEVHFLVRVAKPTDPLRLDLRGDCKGTLSAPRSGSVRISHFLVGLPRTILRDDQGDAYQLCWSHEDGIPTHAGVDPGLISLLTGPRWGHAGYPRGLVRATYTLERVELR